jgi:hypothetical protein
VSAKVVAYNVYGDSDESDVGNGALILTNPDPPISLAEVVASRTADSITIEWSQGYSDGGTAILDYRLSSDQSTDNYIYVDEAISSTQFTVTGLTAGSTYKFKIEARNVFGYSLESDVINILCATRPSPPVTPTTTVVANKVIIDWNPPAENGLAIESYTIVVITSLETFE